VSPISEKRENYKRIYRIQSHIEVGDKVHRYALTPIPLGKALKAEFPEITEVVRLFRNVAGQAFVVRYKDKEFFERDIYLAEPSVFRVFTHTFLAGSPDTALTGPNRMVLTRSFAKKYFGDENPMGKTMQMENGVMLTITGIIEDLPDNSHLKYDALVSFENGPDISPDRFNPNTLNNFWSIHLYTYVLIHEKSSMDSVLNNYEPFHEKYFGARARINNGRYNLEATPLAEVHFLSGFEFDLPTSNIFYVYILAMIAVFLLVLAAINYTNMAAARSAKRAKEIGLRKVMGAAKGDLIRQFLVESIVISLLGLAISLLFALVLMPWFNQLSGKNLTLFSKGLLDVYFILLCIAVFVGLLSGSYPAFYLARLMPAGMVDNRINTGPKGLLFRKMLILFQFAISIVMIIVTILVVQQMNYVNTKDLGFNPDNIIVINERDPVFYSSIMAYNREIINCPYIENVSRSNFIPGVPFGMSAFNVENLDGGFTQQTINNIAVGYNYLDLMGIRLKYGRSFRRDMASDMEQAFIINEAAEKELGWTNNAIGKRIQAWLQADGTYDMHGKVIGVVKDFHFDSLYTKIAPLFMVLHYPQPALITNVRYTPGYEKEAIDYMEKKRKEFPSAFPQRRVYLKDRLNRYYQGDEKLKTLFSYFSIICIVISGMGLLGLSSFVIAQKTRDIGIRKVLGSSSRNIVILFLKDFAVLAVIANIIAWPVAYYGAMKWLENYTYRVEIRIWVFALSALLAFIIVLLTVGLQSLKAASVNPVRSLRYE